MRDKHTQNVSKQACAKFDTGLFEPTLLRNEVALEVAMSVLESHLDNPASSVESLIKDLSVIPRLFEFVISEANGTIALTLVNWILDNFPLDAEGFLISLPFQLLEQLSLFLLFLPYPSITDTPGRLGDCRRSVELAAPVLKTLSNGLLFDRSTVVDEVAPTLLDDDVFFIKRGKSQSQKMQKRAKRMQSRVAIDSKPFASLGIEMPSSRVEAAELSANILTEQKSILQYYLEILRYPHLQEIFKKAYIPDENLSRNDNIATHGVGAELSDNTESGNDTSPAAYPMVQPMKAALYFDSADGFGEWRILISTRADGDLRQARKKNSALFKIIFKKIKDLSKGHFSIDNQKPLTGTQTDIPIFEAKMTRDSRLVYQIDCVPEFESDVEHQVIKVFGIYTHAQLDRRFWDGVGYQLGRKGKEYKRRCIFRNRPRKVGENADVILPASFPPPAEPLVTSPSSGLPDLHKDDLEKLHEMLVLEKYVTFSQALLNSILADQDVAHVFDVSPQEKQIIEHPASCYVLGRSGTGKTTTMLFKMLGIERSWQSCQGTLPKPRQIFVTQSRVLAEKVQEFFQRLYESLSTAMKTPEELRELAATRESRHEQGLVDLDEEVDWRGDLPKRFAELKDEHFPMFVTFDQLCRLLEAEFFGDKNKLLLDIREASDNNQTPSNDYMQQRRSAFVSYGVFLESYWPHFPQPLTKGLDPALVFGEFMGIIKGSEQTLGSANGYLDKDTYFSLSHRTQATFANQRDTIYKLFLAYLKCKRERGDYDAADRTHAILNGMRQQGVPGSHMDFIYIDEAQDNLLIDALILRMMCRNPDTGLFWAGDTAQTISIGSAFRFNDLKAFLYRVEANNIQDPSFRTQPQSFQLAVNYRSHAGIVNCAHSVIELITKFWPNAIDNLAEERGIIEGLKPVFFSGWDQDTARYEQFLFGESGSQIEFGAQQCILVRDDAAREKLRGEVGDIGLILTLYESKGLEFNDVLLYNFFADSTVDLAQWRVVFNALPGEQAGKYKAPQFDDARHNGICRDLKFLYVAITRARKNLWIADSSDKGEPMRVFWTAQGQIQNCTPGSDVPRLAMSSTPEEWSKTALALFNNRRYMQAMHCYERASLPREKAAAYAYYLREQARSTPANGRGDTQRAKAFIDAAEAFWTSAEAAVKEKRSYFRIAAECYSLGGDNEKTANAYFRASEFTLSAQHYRKAGLFDEAVTVIKSHRNVMNPSVADSIIDVSRLEYLREHKLKQAMELFDSDKEALDYMDDCGLDVARATLLEELGRFTEAAELHLEEGRTLEAIGSFLKDRHNPASAERASRSLLDGLWRGLSLGIGPNSELARTNTTLQELLRMLVALDLTELEESTRDEVLMFRAMISNDSATLLQLGERFYRWYHNSAAALMCLDHAFSSLPKLQVAPLADIAISLQNFFLYAKLLQKFTSDMQPCSNDDVRRMFGFELATEEFFLIPKETLLFARCNDRLTPTFQTTDKGITVPRWELDKLLQFVLRDRLRTRVLEENELCRRARALQLCLPYIAFGRCNRQDCPREHINSEDYNVEAYNLRVRIHLQQILIYHTVYAAENPLDQARQRRYWLRQLHEALNPPFYKMGSFHNLQELMIPEFMDALHILRGWALDWLYDLKPVTSLTYTFNSQAAHDHIRRAHCISTYKPPPLLRTMGEDKAYIVHDMLGFTTNSNPMSLSRGILFAHHILEQRVPIDVGVLCNFLDALCGSFIISSRLQYQPTLHDITLPRSWLTRVTGSVNRLSDRDTKLVYLYIKPMTDLLEQMYTGVNADHLLFENRDLSTLGYQIKSVFISRICKNLCLLGYNSRYHWLRKEVLRIVTCLRRFDRFERVYEQYVTAKTWDYLARTVRQYSTTGSALDEMIQIHEASQTSAQLPLFPNVRRIVYNKIEEIPQLLKSGASYIPNTTLRSDAPSFIPSRQISTSADGDDLPSSTAEEMASEALSGVADEVAEDIGVDEKPQAFNLEDVTLTIDSRDSNAVPVAPTAEELDAVDVILSAYRRYVHSRLRREKTTNRMQAIRQRLITTFQEASKEMTWPDRFYKLLFLGPLPHAIVCLECVQDHLRTSKAKVKKRLKQMMHQELEDARAQLTHISQSLKEVIRLQKALEPRSELHVRRDVEELKARILDVKQLTHGLPSLATLEWQNDLNLAVKGIVKSQPLPARKPKPELNMEDDLLDYAEY